MLASGAALPYQIVWAAFSSGGGVRFPNMLPVRASPYALVNFVILPGLIIIMHFYYNTNINIDSHVALSNLGCF